MPNQTFWPDGTGSPNSSPSTAGARLESGGRGAQPRRRGRCVAADDPRAVRMNDAARRAATAADSRFLRVLDCDAYDGVTYCVREWAGGRSLERMLGNGPLTGQQAGWLTREVSEALELLHRSGQPHGAISPATVGSPTPARSRSSASPPRRRYGVPTGQAHRGGHPRPRPAAVRLAHRALARRPGVRSAGCADGARPADEPAAGTGRRTALARRHRRPAARHPRGTTPPRSVVRPDCPRRWPA